MKLREHIWELRGLRRVRRLLGRKGTAAIEFAVAAPVFLLFACMIIENGIMLFTQASLDNATRDAARLIQTGQVNANGNASTLFTNQLCTDLSSFITCASLLYNVQSASTFSSLSPVVTMDSSTFSPGSGAQDVVVQVAYNRAFFIPWVGNLVSTSDSLQMVSTVAFQNEPF